MPTDDSEILELEPAAPPPPEPPLSTQLFKGALVAQRQESTLEQIRDIFDAVEEDDIVAIVRQTADQATFHRNKVLSLRNILRLNAYEDLETEVVFLKAQLDEQNEQADSWVYLLWLAPVVAALLYFSLVFFLR